MAQRSKPMWAPGFSAAMRAGVAASVSFALAIPGALAASTGAADLKSPAGVAMGRVEIVSSSAGAFLHLKISGLTAGGHAVKIHETGKCEGDFASAGGILNPLGAGLGLLNDEGPAAGDLPNVFAGSSGEAEAEFVTSLVQPGAEEGDAVFDDDGSAIVIYAKPDDHQGVLEGAMGERVACGVLSKAP